jgi:hypothetical protein
VAAVVTKIKIKRGCDSSWSFTWLKTALTTCHSQVDSIDASYLLGSDYIYGNTGYTNETFHDFFSVTGHVETVQG